MRLGKIEKWILKHTYLKTVEHDLPPDWKVPRDYWTGDPVNKDAPEFWNTLYKSEVLLNHFDLPTSCIRCMGNMGEYFSGLGSGRSYDWTKERERNKVMVSYFRAISQLKRKGLVSVRKSYYANAEEITLTPRGKEKAVNVNDKSIINISNGVLI